MAQLTRASRSDILLALVWLCCLLSQYPNMVQPNPFRPRLTHGHRATAYADHVLTLCYVHSRLWGA